MYCYKYLIKAFSEMEIQPQPTYRRKSCIFEDFKKFNISEQRFEQQYCSIYKARLKALKDHLLQKAKIKWGRYFIEITFVIILGYIVLYLIFCCRTQ